MSLLSESPYSFLYLGVGVIESLYPVQNNHVHVLSKIVREYYDFFFADI